MTPTTFKNTPALLALILACGMIGGCATRFDDPGLAAQGLVDSLRTNDLDQLERILGHGGKDLLYSGDPVNDQASIERFLAAYDKSHKLVPLDDNTLSLDVGEDGWPLPIPLVKDTLANKWYFDTESGKEEILTRRIGRNELDTIQTCLAIVDAQHEYAESDPEKAGLPVYAEKFFSDSGRKNGLYWETAENQPASPMGPLAAAAESQGYTVPSGAQAGPQPYHGYYFRILKAQGSAAPGGARSYVVNGRLLGGFAIVASPATYGTSGIMTFIVNQEGKLYQRDLGFNTKNAAARIDSYNPDSRWKLVDTVDINPAPATQPAKQNP